MWMFVKIADPGYKNNSYTNCLFKKLQLKILNEFQQYGDQLNQSESASSIFFSNVQCITKPSAWRFQNYCRGLQMSKAPGV